MAEEHVETSERHLVSPFAGPTVADTGRICDVFFIKEIADVELECLPQRSFKPARLKNRYNGNSPAGSVRLLALRRFRERTDKKGNVVDSADFFPGNHDVLQPNSLYSVGRVISIHR